MKIVSIIGKFDTTEGVADGQAVKTNILADEIELVYGLDKVERISTFKWKRNPVKLFWKSIKAVWNSKNVIFLIDEGGIKIFPYLLQIVNIFHKCRIHYYVVGGWLKNYLDNSESAVRVLKKLDAIYVELPAMYRELEEHGFCNGVLVNKFRRMTPVATEKIDISPKCPYKLCYFSRVMREKGIEDCISAVILANKQAGFVKYTLDIYGLIYEPYREVFDEMRKSFPDYIKYKGIVDFNKSSSILKDYFAMLFPTSYASEGYPNTIVDSFAAGLPVIATKWKYNSDIIHEYKDGILIDVSNIEQIIESMEFLSENLDLYGQMRKNCIARCSEYLPENAIKKVVEHLQW